ncbi:MAG: hypothetical protein KF901_02765 [Myxococcales bacterium]|nr:hypothetical protein [Myxococcales bacterium]
MGSSHAIIVREDKLRWPTLVDAFEAARAFLDPRPRRVWRRGVAWEPTAWRWTTPASPPTPQPD